MRQKTYFVSNIENIPTQSIDECVKLLYEIFLPVLPAFFNAIDKYAVWTLQLNIYNVDIFADALKIINWNIVICHSQSFSGNFP